MPKIFSYCNSLNLHASLPFIFLSSKKCYPPCNPIKIYPYHTENFSPKNNVLSITDALSNSSKIIIILSKISLTDLPGKLRNENPSGLTWMFPKLCRSRFVTSKFLTSSSLGIEVPMSRVT